MIYEQLTGKHMERSGGAKLEVYPRNLAAGTEKNNEKWHSEESRCVELHSKPSQPQSLRQPTCSAGYIFGQEPDAVLLGDFCLIVSYRLLLYFLIQTRIQSLKHEQSNIEDATKGKCFLIYAVNLLILIIDTEPLSHKKKTPWP
jgi:hypothetical protein